MTGRFIGLNLNRWRVPAMEHYRSISREPGSEQIASPFALQVLLAVLEQRQPERVLEVGSGIGTMTQLLTAEDRKVYIVEDNAWCLEQMRRRLTRPDRLGLGVGFLHRLIIVDGDQLSPRAALEVLAWDGWILVEGNRRRWRAELRTISHRRFVEVNLRPFDRSKGVWLLVFEPTRAMRIAFGLERLWQAGLSVLSRVWSVLTGAPTFHGKRRPRLRGSTC